ncbi:MAG: bacillithiol biosynthesis cysteine-adding enzyme BshC [Bacteroidetes bacterium]|nr:bacillithiol biosynthesis cysteine-adding enzyme BshC [Bacteroidota bacterium]
MPEFETIAFFPEGYYPKLLEKAIEGDPEVKALYPHSGTEVDFTSIIDKRKAFPEARRQVLVTTLLKQYGNLASGSVLENIQKLAEPKTFTVTTGQQIHIFLGPMYVIYKALSTIWLARELKEKYPENQFVPVFWMASEDHDFEEVNHISVFNRKFEWKANTGGPVGRISTSDISIVLNEIRNAFPNESNLEKALEIFQKAYSENANLAESTRFLLHHFFAQDGLVVLDPDDLAFKQEFLPVMLQDLRSEKQGQAVEEQSRKMRNLKLETGIHGRSPNVFMLNSGIRERIDRVEGGYRLKGSGKEFSSPELEEKLLANPEDFSANVALRPVYQEYILPNLAYIAGPGEFTYWYQLHPVFAFYGMEAPALLARRSFILADLKVREKLHETGINTELMFASETELKHGFLEKSKAGNTIENRLPELGQAMEEVNAFLYKIRHSELKEIKKAGEDYQRRLKAISEDYNNRLLDNELNAATWSKLWKIKQRFFDMEKPQERGLFFMEEYIKNWTFDEKVGIKPVFGKWPLTLVWR